MSAQDAYARKYEARLDEIDLEIAKLKAKAKKAEADAEIELDKTLAELKEKRRALAQKVEDNRGKGREAWEEIEAGAERAWNELTSAVDRAKSRFNL